MKNFNTINLAIMLMTLGTVGLYATQELQQEADQSTSSSTIASGISQQAVNNVQGAVNNVQEAVQGIASGAVLGLPATNDEIISFTPASDYDHSNHLNDEYNYNETQNTAMITWRSISSTGLIHNHTLNFNSVEKSSNDTAPTGKVYIGCFIEVNNNMPSMKYLFGIEA